MAQKKERRSCLGVGADAHAGGFPLSVRSAYFSRDVSSAVILIARFLDFSTSKMRHVRRHTFVGPSMEGLDGAMRPCPVDSGPGRVSSVQCDNTPKVVEGFATLAIFHLSSALPLVVPSQIDCYSRYRCGMSTGGRQRITHDTETNEPCTQSFWCYIKCT